MIENQQILYHKKPLPKKLLNLGLLLFVVGLLGTIAGFFVDSARISFNLVVLTTWLASIGIGSLFFIGIEYLTGAVWSVPFRRVAEINSAIIFVLPILIVPIILNIHSLYHWTHIEAVQNDTILKNKAPYLNETFFIIRTVVFIFLWFLFYYLFISNSRKQDSTSDQKLTKRNSIVSAAFMPVFAISLTFFAIDWLMSLEPHWYSTIFGVYYFAGTFLASLGAFTYISILLNEKGYLVEGLGPDHYYSMGALLFGFTNFWAYIAFSQFMLIWYANLPEETFWFINRGVGSWFYMSIGIILVKFIVPYILLLPQPAKMDPKRLKIAALWILFAHYYDLFWVVMPTFSKNGIPFNWFELVPIVLGLGLFIMVFYYVASKVNLVPIGDPKLRRGVEFHL
ncbi:MAG: Alternative complex III subunit ActF [Candidatus Kapaibacterium sp.]|nr:MAG: Alternative complex III subunit ActF [Candidatus Kapabacteria bacterium]